MQPCGVNGTCEANETTYACTSCGRGYQVSENQLKCIGKYSQFSSRLCHRQFRRNTYADPQMHQSFARLMRSSAVVYTRSSADADNGLDAFSSQSRSTNMVPFWAHCDFSLCMLSAPRTADSLRHFHSSSVL